ncbi:uncharacterized protein LOC143295098 [Babylonia areolata]|uniref:uncharacterized protein LOC143295098 n=1 Tax=Babylonia areolata TaxID=304850 RepID=UPI003FD55DC7
MSNEDGGGPNPNPNTGAGRAQWSQQAYSLEGIASTSSLPMVVRCQATDVLIRRDNPLPLNLAHPILLFSRRSVRKLLARNVLLQGSGGDQRYTETDETVVIPGDYPGHFLRLRSRTAKDHAVHRSVSSLSSHNVPAFLNLTQLTTFQLPAKGAASSNSYPQLDFAPGNVFLPTRALRGSTRVKSGSLLRSKASRHELHYLHCRDERDVHVLVPMNQPGEFVEILRNPQGNGKLSMTGNEIMASQQFPMLVRYVYGGGKPRLTSFSGLLTLLDSFEEDSLVGCVIDGSAFTLLEIPLSSPLLFQMALNNNDLMHLPLVKKALRVCQARATTFASDLKYKFKFAQRILQGRRGQEAFKEDEPLSATNSARMGLTQTYIYL